MIDEDDIYDEDDSNVYRLEKGDRLFTNDDERTHFDKINDYAYNGFRQHSSYSYAIGYKRAADRLVQSLESSTSSSDDALVLPIAFLYRHYLELLLKVLIREGNKVLGNPPDLPKIHEIDKLWEKLKPILIQVYKPYTPEATEVEAVEKCIKEFADIDANSQAFRYPVDKNGKSLLRDKSYLQNISYINLQHLAEKMAGIDFFLGQSDMMLITYPNRVNAISPTTDF